MDGATLDISVQRAGQWQPPRKEFVRATGQVSCAEPPPDPNDYPGALPHMFRAGSLVFTPADHSVDLKNSGESWRFRKGAAAVGWPRAMPSPVDTSTSHVGVCCVMRGRNRS